MRLILVRHGETWWNQKGRFQGHGDVGLNSRGFRQAQSIAETLKPMAPQIVYSSPLPRAIQTAQVIGSACSTSIVPLDELKELDLGEVDGITGPKLRACYPEIYRTWNKDPSKVQMPGGESLGQLQVRAWHAVEQVRKRHTEGIAVAVSHNFAIVSIVCRLLGVPLSRLHRFRVDLGSLTTIEQSQRGWRLISFNELHHLNSHSNQDC